MVKYQSQTIKNWLQWHMFRMTATPWKSSASLGNNKDKKHSRDQWHGMASCKSPSCYTVNQKTGCLGNQ